jgi:hypothetical protein
MAALIATGFEEARTRKTPMRLKALYPPVLFTAGNCTREGRPEYNAGLSARISSRNRDIMKT